MIVIGRTFPAARRYPRLATTETLYSPRVWMMHKKKAAANQYAASRLERLSHLAGITLPVLRGQWVCNRQLDCVNCSHLVRLHDIILADRQRYFNRFFFQLTLLKHGLLPSSKSIQIRAYADDIGIIWFAAFLCS